MFEVRPTHPKLETNVENMALTDSPIASDDPTVEHYQSVKLIQQ